MIHKNCSKFSNSESHPSLRPKLGHNGIEWLELFFNKGPVSTLLNKNDVCQNLQDKPPRFDCHSSVANQLKATQRREISF